ncbi:MAG: YigZ family protein [Anaerolineae bacterium]|nr:YigZ family protein [Anaerolineae bacterium]
MDEYPIPASDATTEIVIKNSRFISMIKRCDSVESARTAIAEIKKQHPNANHHVYAFRIGSGNSVQEGLSDDGEPSGTAGQPVMSVLRGSAIGDALIVVVRYFGGTKLGTGGLVRAYTESAAEALKHCATILKVTKSRVTIEIGYAQFDRIQRVLAEYGAEIMDTRFEQSVTLTAEIATRGVNNLIDALRESTGGSARLDMD